MINFICKFLFKTSFFLFLILINTGNCFSQNEAIEFIGKTPDSGSKTTKITFEILVSKGDSILGFSRSFDDGYCFYSYDKGRSWDFSDIKYQIAPNDGVRREIMPKQIFVKGNNLIFFTLGKFFISEDFGRTFNRISINKSISINESEIGFDENINAGLFQAVVSENLFVFSSYYENCLYISEDCNEWTKVTIPIIEQDFKICSKGDEFFIATMENIYSSSDKGKNWYKLDFIGLNKKNIDKAGLASMGTIKELSCFQNKLYVNIYSNNIDGSQFIYDLDTKKEIPLNGIRNTYIYKDTLYLLTKKKTINLSENIFEDGDIYYYIDTLHKSRFQVSNLCKLPQKRGCGLWEFEISNDFIIIDKQLTAFQSVGSLNKKTVDLEIKSIPYENISQKERDNYSFIDKCVKECNQKLVSTRNAYQLSASFSPRGYAAKVKEIFYSENDINVFKTTDIQWGHLTDININDLTFQYSCICMDFATGFEPKYFWARSSSGFDFDSKQDPFDIDIDEATCRCINYYKMGTRKGFSIVVRKEQAQKCYEMLKELCSIAKSKSNNAEANILNEFESWEGNNLIKWHTDSRGIKQGSYEVRDRSGKITTLGEYKDNEKVGKWIERGLPFSYGGIGMNCTCQGHHR